MKYARPTPWHEYSRNTDNLRWALIGLCLLAVLAEAAYTRFANWLALDGLYAGLACVTISLVARAWGKAVQRETHYYDR